MVDLSAFPDGPEEVLDSNIFSGASPLISDTSKSNMQQITQTDHLNVDQALKERLIRQLKAHRLKNAVLPAAMHWIVEDLYQICKVWKRNTVRFCRWLNSIP